MKSPFEQLLWSNEFVVDGLVEPLLGHVVDNLEVDSSTLANDALGGILQKFQYSLTICLERLTPGLSSQYPK